VLLLLVVNRIWSSAISPAAGESVELTPYHPRLTSLRRWMAFCGQMGCLVDYRFEAGLDDSLSSSLFTSLTPVYSLMGDVDEYYTLMNLYTKSRELINKGGQG